MNDLTKYSRQILLPDIGSEGQKKISAAKIICIGAGGLGCPALLYLAAAGIGTIGIADHDTVDVSNLQRQILFTPQEQGKQKTEVAKKRLTVLNSDIRIITHNEKLTAENAEDLLVSYDIVIDGTDNFKAKFAINDVAVKLDKPMIYGALQGFEGRIAVFDATKGPCYRCLQPAEPATDIQSCADTGIIGAVAGMIGTIQAAEAIKIIVGSGNLSPLYGRMWVTDVRTMQTNILTIPKRKDCAICSK